VVVAAVVPFQKLENMFREEEVVVLQEGVVAGAVLREAPGAAVHCSIRNKAADNNTTFRIGHTKEPYNTDNTEWVETKIQDRNQDY
jgi:hypothetical protein